MTIRPLDLNTTKAEPAESSPPQAAPSRPDIITKEYILTIPPHVIFAEGVARGNELQTVISRNDKRQWRWIAVKGGGPDWAIYCSPAYWTTDKIHGLGDKVLDNNVIKLLVRCDDSALEIYRR